MRVLIDRFGGMSAGFILPAKFHVQGREPEIRIHIVRVPSETFGVERDRFLESPQHSVTKRENSEHIVWVVPE